MSMICLLCKENETERNGQKVCDTCVDNAADYLERNAEVLAEAPNLLTSCLALIDRLEAIEQADGIDTITASTLHDAKVVTLNAQGRTEEGYNA